MRKNENDNKRIGYWFEESKEYSDISKEKKTKRERVSNFKRYIAELKGEILCKKR